MTIQETLKTLDELEAKEMVDKKSKAELFHSDDWESGYRDGFRAVCKNLSEEINAKLSSLSDLSNEKV